MAEATDRPQDAGQQSTVRTELPSASDSGHVPDAPPITETYRPLSLVALAGFALAVLYTLIVLIGAGIALLSRKPWLMPFWSFLLPLLVLGVCWAARTRIRDSEGTLSGLAFTTWGVRLAVLVGLTYTAYYAATFFAVRGQAVDCAERFLNDIKQGQHEQAFALAQGLPIRDMDRAALRNEVESRFNNPQGRSGASGEFSRFRQTPFVCFLTMGGEQTRLTLVGVSEWSYSKDGYHVVLKYHAATPLATFDLNVETLGRDSRAGERKGRQWQIALTPSGTILVPDSLNLTPPGKEIMRKVPYAQGLARTWAEKVDDHRWQEAWLDTLPPAERARLLDAQAGQQLLAPAPLAGLMAVGALEHAAPDLVKKLEGGSLITIDTSNFWAGQKQREDILQRVQKTFQPSREGRPLFGFRIPQGSPLVFEKDGRLTVLVDADLQYLEENTGKPQYVVEAQLAVTAESVEAAGSPDGWRIASLKVLSGRTPPRMPDPRQPPGAPGQQPPPGMMPH